MRKSQAQYNLQQSQLQQTLTAQQYQQSQQFQHPQQFQQPQSFLNAKFVRSPSHSSSPNYETINSILIAKTTYNTEVPGKRLDFETMSQSQFINMNESGMNQSVRNSEYRQKTYKGNYNIKESLVAKDRLENICKNFVSFFGNQNYIPSQNIANLYTSAYSSLTKDGPTIPSNDQLGQLFNVYDENRDGKITLEDLMTLATRYLSFENKKVVYTSHVQQKLDVARRLFKKFDTQKRGFLTEKQVPYLLDQTYKAIGKGYSATQEDIKSWMQITDEDHDGKVKLQQYETSVIRSLRKQGIKIYDQ